MGQNVQNNDKKNKVQEIEHEKRTFYFTFYIGL